MRSFLARRRLAAGVTLCTFSLTTIAWAVPDHATLKTKAAAESPVEAGLEEALRAGVQHLAQTFFPAAGLEERVLTEQAGPHAGPVVSVAFSPSGGALVSGGPGAVRLWSLVNASVHNHPMEGREPWAVGFARTAQGGMMRFTPFAIGRWNLGLGEQQGYLRESPAPEGRWSDDNPPRVTISGDGDTIGVITMEGFPGGEWYLNVFPRQGGEKRQVPLPIPGQNPVALRHDGGEAVVGSGRRIAVFSTEEPPWAAGPVMVDDLSAEITSVALRPDGQTVALGLQDGTVALVDRPTGGTQPSARAFGRAQGAITSLAFSPDGETLAAGVADGTIHSWPVPSAGLEESLVVPAVPDELELPVWLNAAEGQKLLERLLAQRAEGERATLFLTTSLATKPGKTPYPLSVWRQGDAIFQWDARDAYEQVLGARRFSIVPDDFFYVTTRRRLFLIRPSQNSSRRLHDLKRRHPLVIADALLPPPATLAGAAGLEEGHGARTFALSPRSWRDASHPVLWGFDEQSHGFVELGIGDGVHEDQTAPMGFHASRGVLLIPEEEFAALGGLEHHEGRLAIQRLRRPQMQGRRPGWWFTNRAAQQAVVLLNVRDNNWHRWRQIGTVQVGEVSADGDATVRFVPASGVRVQADSQDAYAAALVERLDPFAKTEWPIRAAAAQNLTRLRGLPPASRKQIVDALATSAQFDPNRSVRRSAARTRKWLERQPRPRTGLEEEDITAQAVLVNSGVLLESGGTLVSPDGSAYWIESVQLKKGIATSPRLLRIGAASTTHVSWVKIQDWTYTPPSTRRYSMRMARLSVEQAIQWLVARQQAEQDAPSSPPVRVHLVSGPRDLVTIEDEAAIQAWVKQVAGDASHVFVTQEPSLIQVLAEHPAAGLEEDGAHVDEEPAWQDGLEQVLGLLESPALRGLATAGRDGADHVWDRVEADLRAAQQTQDPAQVHAALTEASRALLGARIPRSSLEILFSAMKKAFPDVPPAAGLEESNLTAHLDRLRTLWWSEEELQELRERWFTTTLEITAEEMERLAASAVFGNPSGASAGRLVNEIAGMNRALTIVLLEGAGRRFLPQEYQTWMKELPTSALVGPVAHALQEVLDQAIETKTPQGIFLPDLMRQVGLDPMDERQRERVVALVSAYGVESEGTWPNQRLRVTSDVTLVRTALAAGLEEDVITLKPSTTLIGMEDPPVIAGLMMTEAGMKALAPGQMLVQPSDTGLNILVRAERWSPQTDVPSQVAAHPAIRPMVLQWPVTFRPLPADPAGTFNTLQNGLQPSALIFDAQLVTPDAVAQWRPEQVQAVPTLLWHPRHLIEDVTGEAPTEHPMAFVDFLRLIRIAQRLDIPVLILQEATYLTIGRDRYLLVQA